MSFASRRSALAALAVAIGLALTPVTALAEGAELYRMYNPASGEHLYTSHPEERDALQENGWNYEQDQTNLIPGGPYEGAISVYRLYNPVTTEHLYTTDLNEMDVLTKERGWKFDFSGEPAFYGATGYYTDVVPMYRIYNSAAPNFGHLFTTDENERNTWLNAPNSTWNDEGVAWYTYGKPTIQFSEEDYYPSTPDFNAKDPEDATRVAETLTDLTGYTRDELIEDLKRIGYEEPAISQAVEAVKDSLITSR